jgi:peptide deformylase
MEQLLEFFAHEIGHHMGKAYNDRVKEEKKAREFEVTAVIAHRLAKAILKEKRANK